MFLMRNDLKRRWLNQKIAVVRTSLIKQRTKSSFFAHDDASDSEFGWNCHERSENNYQPYRCQHQQHHLQYLCFWNEQDWPTHRSAALAQWIEMNKRSCINNNQPISRSKNYTDLVRAINNWIMQLDRFASASLLGSFAANEPQKRQNSIDSSWPSDVLPPPAAGLWSAFRP